MEDASAFKRALVYRAIVTGSFLGGLVVIATGVVAGIGGDLWTLVSNPMDAGTVLAEANLVLVGVFVVIGVLVWQVGKAYALFYTLAPAAGAEAATQFDREALRSELLEGLNDHLGQLEEDVLETRRGVQELKRAEHAAAFDESEVSESASLEAGSSTGGVVGRRPLDRTDASETTSPATDGAEESEVSHSDRSEHQGETGSQSGAQGRQQSTDSEDPLA